MSIVRFFSRIIVGSIFIFSGFVKAVDPMGSTYKFSDYFTAFGMDALTGLAFPLAILLSTLEFTVGVALVFNAQKKLSAWGALLFMLLFTPLTLVLAITNKVTDCGCFGDVLTLSNWETFWKNLFILVPTLLIFFGRKLKEKTYPLWEQNLLVAFAIVFSIVTSVYSYKHLPIIDFRPYHIGANISEGMMIPDGAPADEYKSILKYEKDGVVKEFDETNYPWQDSTWTFVDSEQIKIKEGYTPPIHDFSISNEMDGDITDQVLNDENYTFILITKEIDKLNEESLPKILDLSMYALEKGYSFIALTASGLQECEAFKADHELPIEFYNTDEIQLKTIVRSNPGLILIQNGTILNKWHFNDFPAVKELNGDLAAYSITKHQKLNIKLVFISITSTLLLLICLFLVVSRSSRARK
ncbi:BT_3928 family protein [Marinifilum caeruleilacunae]|uniref:DoxX family protein n=1 Tax=Marinifilum caeruleilacunae TaxID=2499076 RepID=A0ABX1WV89_9BACT|nr:BT_3928 family protein [Marinifilum caeruleilacunae]NOU60029.1 DoxX family protein [Marinifilum caeruleilacunae]